MLCANGRVSASARVSARVSAGLYFDSYTHTYTKEKNGGVAVRGIPGLEGQVLYLDAVLHVAVPPAPPSVAAAACWASRSVPGLHACTLRRLERF